MDPNPRPAPPPAAPGRTRWTPAKQRIFLAALLETGCVTAAARAAGMTRQSAHRLRAKLPGTPFDRTWTAALGRHAARLADPFADLSPPGSVGDTAETRRRHPGVA